MQCVCTGGGGGGGGVFMKCVNIVCAIVKNGCVTIMIPISNNSSW